MRTIAYIAGKDLQLQWRDRLGFFWWIVGFPLLIAILIGTIFSGMLGGPLRRTPVGYIDLADTSASRDYARTLERVGSLEIVPMTQAQAAEGIRRGNILAYVQIDPGFHISPAIFFGRPLPVVAAYDPVRRAEGVYLQTKLNHAAAEYLRERWFDPVQRRELIRLWLADLGQNPAIIPLAGIAIEGSLETMNRYLGVTTSGNSAAATRPAEFAPVQIKPAEKGSLQARSSFEICFPIGIIWGLLGLAAEFAIAFARERESGTLLRLRAAPFSRWQLLIGNGAACFVACIGVMVMLLAVGYWGYGVRLHSPAVLAVALLSIAVCFVGLTMLLSILGRTESAVGGGSWAILLIIALLGGGMVPQMFMPDWMGVAGNLSPVKWAIIALEGGIWREFTLRDALAPCGTLLALGLLFGVVGTAVLYRAER